MKSRDGGTGESIYQKVGVFEDGRIPGGAATLFLDVNRTDGGGLAFAADVEKGG